MDILVIGENTHLAECEQRFGSRHRYTLAAEHRDAERLVHSYELIFDFIIDEEPYQFGIYAHRDITVFLNTSKVSLAQLVHPFVPLKQGNFFGFNGLPTFLSNPLLEVSMYNPDTKNRLHEICAQLDTPYKVVDDRPGLVTSRIVCMIINEAYYTLQEGIASERDIDTAMKLGTNYPYGPFEWAKRIGVRHVYEVLETLYDETKDERYKISPLLRKEYLTGKI